MISFFVFFFFKQKTAYEIYQCDWSSDVCSSDLIVFKRGPSFFGSKAVMPIAWCLAQSICAVSASTRSILFKTNRRGVSESPSSLSRVSTV